ncbi:MAG: CPBP family intramembrane glutamic endopeptidase [Bacteroidota bacterium]
MIWYFFGEGSFFDLFENKRTLFLQILVGAIFGAIAALIAIQIIRIPAIEEALKNYTNLMARLKLTLPLIILISIAAGVGEEILFRAVIQNLIGLWPAAIIFVAIHGYLNPLNWRISIYGIYLVLTSASFGYLYTNLGIWSAAMAHATFDFVLLFYVKHDLLYPEPDHHHDEEE